MKTLRDRARGAKKRRIACTPRDPKGSDPPVRRRRRGSGFSGKNGGRALSNGSLFARNPFLKTHLSRFVPLPRYYARLTRFPTISITPYEHINSFAVPNPGAYDAFVSLSSPRFGLAVYDNTLSVFFVRRVGNERKLFSCLWLFKCVSRRVGGGHEDPRCRVCAPSAADCFRGSRLFSLTANNGAR